MTVADKIQSLGSVTGRVGFTANAAMIYVKGGYVWADNQVSATGFGATFAESRFHSGWTIGRAGRLNREIGLTKSRVVGLVFALASIFPLYFLGHWMGTPS